MTERALPLYKWAQVKVKPGAWQDYTQALVVGCEWGPDNRLLKSQGWSYTLRAIKDGRQLVEFMNVSEETLKEWQA